MVIDRCFDCLCWDISFFVDFVTSDFSTSDTTRDTNLDTFCSFFHSFCNCLLDDTTVWETTLNLTTDAITDESRVNIWVFDFFDINVYFFTKKCMKFFLEFCEIFTVFSENESCTRCIDDNTETSITVSDSSVSYWKSFEKLSNKITDNNILTDSFSIFCFIIVSCRCPRAGYTDTPRDGTDFVSHKRKVYDLFMSEFEKYMTRTFDDSMTASTTDWTCSLVDRTLTDRE